MGDVPTVCDPPVGGWQSVIKCGGKTIKLDRPGVKSLVEDISSVFTLLSQPEIVNVLTSVNLTDRHEMLTASTVEKLSNALKETCCKGNEKDIRVFLVRPESCRVVAGFKFPVKNLGNDHAKKFGTDEVAPMIQLLFRFAGLMCENSRVHFGECREPSVQAVQQDHFRVRVPSASKKARLMKVLF